MARKKKKSRKYIPRNEFRYNKSPVASGHPHYVFGETDTKYKSMGLTHNPDEAGTKVPLLKNPNPKDTEKSYLKTNVTTAKKDYYSAPLPGWHFDKRDMPLVRLEIKKYKKSSKRRPKGWYSRKKANKKR